MKKLDVNDFSLVLLTLILSLHYLVVWPFATMNSYWVAHALADFGSEMIN